MTAAVPVPKVSSTSSDSFNMAASVLNVTFISASTANISGKNEDNYSNVMKVIFCIISISSIVPNMLFLIAMLFNYRRMRGYHNILLYNMMLSDTLAGIAVLITPTVSVSGRMDTAHGLAGEIYCRVLYSQFMLFLFGVVSVYTVTFLSTERWLAVQYPFKYRTAVSSSKMIVCVMFIWLLGLLANAPNLTEMSPRNDYGTPCHWKHKNYQTREILAFLEIFLKFILPTLILILVLLSLYKKFQHENLDSSTRPHREKQLLHMCAATSLVVLICWSPNQVFYLLYKLDMVTIDTHWHRLTVALAHSTSAINPIIYYVISTSYRQCLLTFLLKILSKCKPKARLHLTTTYSLAHIENNNTCRDNQTNGQQVFYASHEHMRK